MRDVRERFAHVREAGRQHELISEIQDRWAIQSAPRARVTVSISLRFSTFNSAIRAPSPPRCRPHIHSPAGNRDQPDQHGLFFIDVTAEAARQNDFIRRFQITALQQRARRDEQRGLRQLDLSHILLGDRDVAAYGCFLRPGNDILPAVLALAEYAPPSDGADRRLASLNLPENR